MTAPLHARPRLGRLVGVAAVMMMISALLGACAITYDPTPVPVIATSTSTSPSAAASAATCSNATASYTPGTLPAADSLPSGSTMAAIRKRGRLVAGISADTYLMGSRNPITGQIEGFDIDMVNMVAAAIFGTAKGHVQFRVITAADRISVLTDSDVDIVVRNMTITCDRWKQIAFSAEYYGSGQKLLVSRDSTIASYEDLAGKRVCAPTGTTNIAKIAEVAPKATVVGVANHTACLALFQQGKVDAITGDDTVLAGLAAQDPYAKVVGKAFTSEPYGIGVNAGHVDFVRFINAALAHMESSGAWKKSYNTWLGPSLGMNATPPKPVYGR